MIGREIATVETHSRRCEALQRRIKNPYKRKEN